MPLLRSQIYLSRTSMARLAQRRTDIEEEVVKIYKVPVSGDEIADIHAAYYDCAQRTASAPKRKAIRPPKKNKRKLRLAVPAVPLRLLIMVSSLRFRRLRTCGVSKYAMNLLPSGQSSGMITRGLVTTCTIVSVPVFSPGQIDSSHPAADYNLDIPCPTFLRISPSSVCHDGITKLWQVLRLSREQSGRYGCV